MYALADYDYHLPPQLIAQTAAARRSRSRLMVMSRRRGSVRHHHFDHILELLAPADVLVVNNTRVMPARLLGRKASGGRVEVLILDPAELPDSRFRRRLRHLQERLEHGGADSAAAERVREEAAAASRAAAAGAAGAGGAGGAGAEAEEGGADPRQELRERARAHTRGRRLLFVSNRKDPQLAGRLTEALQPAVLDWCDGKDHQLNAAAERIRAGSYDLVLSATGFLSHSGDGKVRDACGPGTRYVPAFKGRELACLRALVRDLG